MIDRLRLKPEQLRWTCDCDKLGFTSTETLKDLAAPIGQDRAVAALGFGVNIQSDGYNVFVMGPVGTGRSSMSRAMLDQAAAQQPAPGDWVYVHNFDQPNQPKALHLPSGSACEFRDDMNELIEDVQRELAAAFESEEYVDRREEALKTFREERQAELAAFEKEAEAANMVVGRGPAGVLVAPAKDGEVMSPQDYAELTEEDRKAIDARRAKLQDKLEEMLRRHHRKDKMVRVEVKKLDQEVARFAVGHLFEELQKRYATEERVCEHLRQILDDIIDNIEGLRARDEDTPQMPFPIAVPTPDSRYSLYGVNVLLSCGPRDGAPVVYESNPTIDNLTGLIEHRTQMGALVTDYTMIRPGALHRANGGYLVLEAETLLRKPYAYEALKRALKNKLVRIESLQDQFRFMSTVTLEPEPIALDVKVVLVGSPELYYLLYNYDDDFRKLFKVKADFDASTPRNRTALRRYAQFVATVCRREGLPHFEAPAVARILEQASRLVADQMRLTTRFVDVADLVREAAYWCGHNGNSLVTAEDVQRAIEEHVSRSNRIEERMREMSDRGLIELSFKGKEIGQVNALSVIPLGDYWFGRPNRLRAITFVGKSGVMQIDREAKLTGRLHDKGLLTLTGFLNGRYAHEKPLTLAASLTFEQNYDLIEGDSASSAELYAILSSLAGAPISQGFAVTGSVNQAGHVQAIGGVNEKIEGFFDSCKSRGLTGEQGVLIPKSNVQHLMLKPEVIEAVRDGKFHIYAVSTVDEGLEVLTGVPAGSRRKNGTYPEGTINQLVTATLENFAASFDGRGMDNGTANHAKPAKNDNNNR